MNIILIKTLPIDYPYTIVKLISSTKQKIMSNIKTAFQIVNEIKLAKGQFVKASWKSKVKTSAKYKDVMIEKRTVAVVRAGINFSNLSSVKKGIAEIERFEVGSLPWGQWKEFPYIIEHRGKEYIRLYPSPSKNHIPQTKFFVNGIETSKKDVLKYLTPSKVKELTENKERPECFTIKYENVLDITK